MPTGYTAIIDEKEDVTFQDYAWRCARAMGALITMRDESFDAPIPDRFEPSSFWADQYAQVHKELEQAYGRTDEEWERLAEKAREDSTRSAKRCEEKNLEVVSRYQRMREQVQAWEPPSPEHDGLKEFMLEQLATGAPYIGRALPVMVYTGADYRERRIAELERNLVTYAAENQKEIGRTEARNEWLRELRESLADR